MSAELRLLTLEETGLFHPTAQQILDLQAVAGWGLFYDYVGRSSLEDLRLVLELDSKRGDTACSYVTFAQDAILSNSNHVRYDVPLFTWALESFSMTRNYAHPKSKIATNC